MAENKKVILTLENVSKSFAKVESDEVTHALDNVSVTMESGEFISLVGPSGCGKSTILRLVAGLIVPTLGKVAVNGKEIEGPSPNRGMVFQRPTLFPWLTVEDNIAFSLNVQGKLKGNEDKVQRMIDIIGLEKFKDDYPGQLSGGMAQRVALVRSLINQPEILLLDEPLGALDAFTRMHMQDEILNIWSESKQLALMVTHDVDEAIYMGTRVLVMDANPEEATDVLMEMGWNGGNREMNVMINNSLQFGLSDEFTKTTLEDFAGRYIRLGLIETMDNVEDVMAVAWTPVLEN